MAFSNIVLFGVGGTNIVLARESSKTQFPESVHVVRIPDDFPYSDMVAALKGQDVVICMSGFSAHGMQYKLIDAAIEAGVKRFIPSEWGMDNADPKNQELCPVFNLKAEVADYLHAKESKSFSWTAVANSIWLDWALDEPFIGIDTKRHTAEYWCEGTHTPSHTTLPYVAQATLQVLGHPELFKNQRVFLSPFQASQKEIVAELEILQGFKYKISNADSEKIVKDAKSRWNREKDAMAAGTLVSAGVLLPGFGSDFVSSRKSPILEEVVEMPVLTLKAVIKAWVEAHPETRV